MASVGCGRLGFEPRAEGGPGADAGPSGSGAEGFWVVTEARDTASGLTRTRDDLVDGVRSDLRITGATAHVRQLDLAGGVGVNVVGRSMGLEIDGDRWILSHVETTVYDVVWDGPDRAVLDHAPTDPRTQGPPPALDRLVITRAPPPPLMLIGDWILTSVRYPSWPGELPAGACAPDGAGGSMQATGGVMTPDHFVSLTLFTLLFFVGTTCQGTPTVTDDSGLSYFELTGTAYRSWIDLDSSPPVVLTGQLEPSASGRGFRLAQTACTGALECDDLPVVLEFEPAP